MQQTITGKAYVLGDNVDTDQIIPAQYLTYDPSIPEEYRMFGKYSLSSVPPSQSGLPKGNVPFHRNAVNGGYLIPFESESRLCDRVCTGDELEIDVAGGVLRNKTTGEQYRLK